MTPLSRNWLEADMAHDADETVMDECLVCHVRFVQMGRPCDDFEDITDENDIPQNMCQNCSHGQQCHD